MNPRPVLLAIFDGFGLNPSRAHNAWSLARTPNLDYYFASYPHTVLQASGRAVGLPESQFGNSEVGHLTLGAGRVLEQDLVRIALTAMPDDDVLEGRGSATDEHGQAIVAATQFFLQATAHAASQCDEADIVR